MPPTLPTLLTGEPKVQSMQLKIKANADHAGHSLLLALLKDTISSKLENFLVFLNNNLLIAIINHRDVTEDGNHGPWNILKLALKNSPLTIHTTLWLELVTLLLQRAKLKLNKLPTSPHHQLLNLRPLLPLDQLQSLLKLTHMFSKDTPVESLTLQIVELNLITPSPLLVMELTQDKTTTSLETHGELHGEIKDTLRLLPLMEAWVSVVFNKSHSGQQLIELVKVSLYH